MTALKMNFRSNLHRFSWFICLTLCLVLINNVATLDLNKGELYYYETVNSNQSDSFKETAHIKGSTISMLSQRVASNLTAIKWAHAVNSQQLLDEALKSDIDMIEADIVLGKINGTGDDLPVMAHPTVVTSDITLKSFLQQIMLYNEQTAVEKMKGVKLDFKSIEVFEGSIDILNELVPLMNYPVWLNADIIRGPVNHTTSTPVDPARFLAGSAQFKDAVLSIGWTTRWGADYREGNYTDDEIENMRQAIRVNNVTETKQPITFPVRAGIAANSREQLHDLVRSVNDTNECTLTIWSSENDYVDVAKLRQLIFSFGFERIYLDVPEPLASQLDLGRADTDSTTLSTLVNFGLVSVCLLAASLLIQRMQL